eukprot:GDKJ01040256.1.p1 GENE.GDKJ01040256.1~~GDKJ01040256.1.p1  ORF type:complete len:225 (+),score=38.17 GDKJ01040256.1:70-675(+)
MAKNGPDSEYWERKIEPVLGELVIEALRLQPPDFKKWLHNHFMSEFEVIDNADKPENVERHTFALALSTARNLLLSQTVEIQQKMVQIKSLNKQLKQLQDRVDSLRALATPTNNTLGTAALQSRLEQVDDFLAHLIAVQRLLQSDDPYASSVGGMGIAGSTATLNPSNFRIQSSSGVVPASPMPPSSNETPYFHHSRIAKK